MFENLTERLNNVFKELRRHAKLTEEDVDLAMREVRMALLEADVNYSVVKSFVGRVRERSIGVDVSKALNPAQQVVKIVNEEHSPGVEEAGCDACPHALREVKANPFPAVFPNSEWVKISYPGPAGWWHYISGKIYKGGAVAAKALGVPGEYGMTPPIWLEGFGTYLRCVSGDALGYWLMFQDAETGEVLDMGLSPHGA
jgi:hypothetical protein